MPKLIVLTGSPGVGKSSVLHELATRGFQCFEEPARKILHHQLKIDGPALPSKDPELFVRALLKDIEQSHQSAKESGKDVVFFDRAFPDLFMYCACFNVDPRILKDWEATLVYSKKVFLFPIWEEIFVNDELRKMPFEESFVRKKELITAYDRLGYTLIDVPKCSVEDRAEFLLSKI